jgi:pilus assembly protein CpaF
MSTFRYSDASSYGVPPRGSSGDLRNGAGRAGPSAREQAFFELQRKIQHLLITDLETSKAPIDHMPPAQLRREVEERLQRIIDAEAQRQQLPLSKSDRVALVARCLADILGYGPIEPLLADENVTEIMVNGPHHVWVDQQRGKMMETEIRFYDSAHLMRVIERIVSEIGRRVDETTPLVDARLKDGSRVNIVIPPVALNGPVLTIRKFAAKALQPKDLIDNNTISHEMMLFLQRCVEAQMNIIVSGGTNTGKTTILNVLSVFIPHSERIVTIEDAAELQLQQVHVVRMESRPPNVEGKNQVTIRQLVANALRMRPDRIIVGECRGGEALDMLQAMNTGHEGSMTTLHANSAQDVLNRLEMLVLQAGIEMPDRAIHAQILSAVNLLVHLDHFEDGTRRVTSIAELRPGASGTGAEVVEIFAFERSGADEHGRVLGRLRPRGIVPRLAEIMEQRGYPVPPTIFKREARA